jgi:hypothetical protein
MIMSVVQAFSDRIKLKALLVAFIGYLVLSVVLFGIVVQFWMPSGVSAERLQQLVEADETLLLWQNILGTVLSVLSGYVAARMSGAQGLRNSLSVGGLLVLYGILGIYLHPNHPVEMQLGKLIWPIPLTLLGGWIALWRKSRSSKQRDHA